MQCTVYYCRLTDIAILYVPKAYFYSSHLLLQRTRVKTPINKSSSVGGLGPLEGRLISYCIETQIAALLFGHSWYSKQAVEMSRVPHSSLDGLPSTMCPGQIRHVTKASCSTF